MQKNLKNAERIGTMVCKVCHCVIEPSDILITCCVCGEMVHRQCRGAFNSCDICTDEIIQKEQQEEVEA
jgi:hypothetical protein